MAYDDIESTDHPVDPAKSVAEKLIYSDSDEAGAALRQFIHDESHQAATNREHHSRVARDKAASNAQVAKFKETNPDWDDPLVEPVMSAVLKSEQRRDLEQYAEQFRQENGGRDRTDAEIVRDHQLCRAYGYTNVRSVEKLLDDAAAAVEKRFGIRRRLNSEDAVRKRAMAERVNRTRNLRGLEPKQFDSDEFKGTSVQPSVSADRGTTSLDSFSKLHDAGFGSAPDAVDPTQSRRNAVLRMQASRPNSRSKHAIGSPYGLGPA